MSALPKDDLLDKASQYWKILARGSLLISFLFLISIVFILIASLKQHEHFEEEITKHRNNLEDMIRERTVELQQELTERKQAEKALKESEAKYMDFYENAPDMYASVNAQTTLIEACNMTLANNLGYSKEEIIGRPVFDIYHPDCLEEVKNTFKLFVEIGEIHDKELRLQKKKVQN